ncbi:MAG: DNA alkylation repair protein [Clostridia bacterium]|nr:DNA alkylation repair protein [Clostridia bacterium]MDD4798482.1 DNA alkylation repair protein [Clostridia bacterium]
MEQLKQRLLALSDEKYRRFSAKLNPTVDPDSIIGVRLPALRAVAKELAAGDFISYLQKAQDDSFEETLLQGMVIAYAKCPAAQKLPLVQAFVPKIDNWATCDSFCSSFKLKKSEREQYWNFILPYFTSSRDFDLRFAVVMLIFHFIDDEHLKDILSILDAVRHENYYVKMAVSWAVSTCFGKYPERTLCYLKTDNLDDFTHNKAIQKIRESDRVSAQDKAAVQKLKR